jgi:predicted acylesterase/phospholipase RssA
MDVLSVLSTVAGLPSLLRTAHAWIGPSVSRYRLSPALLFFCLMCLLVLEGCAGLAVGESKSFAGGRPLAEQPMTFRTLGSDRRFSEVSSVAAAEQLRAVRRAAREGNPLTILALSGGGVGGAFGAGAIAGLTRTGTRPRFDVVTGVSAGALIAPYAFLGPTWDQQLLDAYTGLAGDDLRQSRGLAVIFGSTSIYSGKPLRNLVDVYVSDDMIHAIADEAAKGRLLLVATTDVASGESVVWDLGSIAMNGGASARTLFRDVLVASASVPGMFPPVIIRIEEDGFAHEQAHVDGAATMPFFVPPAFLQRTRNGPGTGRTAVFVIVDGSLSEGARTTRLTARSILSRSIRVGLDHLLLTTLELTAATARLEGADLQYSSLPVGYPLPDVFDFGSGIRRPLFHYAYQCAETGRLWMAFPPSDDDRETSHGMAGSDTVPCPADDPLVGVFATR